MIYYYLCYYTQNQSVMREYANKPDSQFRTLDSNPRASRQAPIADILQAYKKGTLGRQPVQRESMEDDELLQAKASGQAPVGAILQRHKENIQRFATEQEDDLLQGKFDTAQREAMEDDDLLQGKFESNTTSEQLPVQREEKPNNTGLPDNLKTGIENLSGYSMDDVKVHYNSDKPAQLQALAYAQGTNIHVAPGQEQHLPHEAWHVVQQKQGRVQPTMQMQGVNVNDNEGLEKEAEIMGNKSIGLQLIQLRIGQNNRIKIDPPIQMVLTPAQDNIVQGIDKNKVSHFNADRIISFLRNIICANKNVYPRLYFDNDLRSYMNDILNNLLEKKVIFMKTTDIEIRNRIRQEKGFDFPTVRGHLGKVNSDIVEQIMRTYTVNSTTIIQGALNTIAAHQGGNGVRKFNPPISGYTAELKIQAMGGDRVYSNLPIGQSGTVLFNQIGNHL